MMKAKFLQTQLQLLKLLFLVLIATPSMAQVDSLKFDLLHKIDLPCRLLATDKLQQSYVVTSENEVLKYDSNGKELFRYNNNKLGKLGHLDVANPFNILCYYPDYRTIITLDRTLNKTGEFNLMNLEVLEVQTVGMSNDNNIWLYDDVSFQLKKISTAGLELNKSDNLSMILNKTIEPNFILERDNKVFVNDPNQGLFLFDNFGSYIKTIPILNLQSFQVFGDQLIYQENGELISFQMQALSTRKLPVPNNLPEGHLQIQNERMYFINDEGFQIFGFY